MHRFFIEPRTLSQDRSVWIDRKDDIRWRYLVQGFREKIRRREWKAVDLHIRLCVKVETWDGTMVLVEHLDTRTDYYLASAYLRAGILEKTAIIVYAHNHISWESLRRFRAVNPRRGTRRKDGVTKHNGKTAIRSSPARATKERCAAPTSLVNGSGRSGDPDTVAGGYRSPPKEGSVDCRGKDPDSRGPTLTGRGPSGAGHRSVAPRDPV